ETTCGDERAHDEKRPTAEAGRSGPGCHGVCPRGRRRMEVSESAATAARANARAVDPLSGAKPSPGTAPRLFGGWGADTGPPEQRKRLQPALCAREGSILCRLPSAQAKAQSPAACFLRRRRVDRLQPVFCAGEGSIACSLFSAQAKGRSPTARRLQFAGARSS